MHSTWFAALAESGFLGFGVFMTMVVRTVRSSIRSARALSPAGAGEGYDPAAFGMAQAVMAGMAGFVVCGSFLTQAFTWPLYILLSLAVAVGRYIEATRPDPHSATQPA